MNLKDIFKIILVLQLLACTLASYGHPDVEVFSLPNQPSRDQRMLEAAIKRGMDGEAVAELLRTRKPVVKTTTSPGGFTKTITYKMEPDGSIASRTTYRHHYTYSSDSVPDDLKNAPTGSLMRTFTDSDGKKVTQTVTVNQGKPSSVPDSDDLSGDWFTKSFPSWQDETPSSPAFNAGHQPIGSPSWSSSGPGLSKPETSIYSPTRTSTNTRTYIRPNGEKHVVQTTFSSNGDSSKSNISPLSNFNWPKFNYPVDPVFHPDGSFGWEEVKEPESTTKKKLDTWDWPKFPTFSTTPTTTTVKPKLFIEADPATRNPLPNLNDFLTSQYAPNRNSGVSPSTAKTITYGTSTPKPLTSTPKIINIEDLPVVAVLHNGKPASESVLRALPPHLTPRTPTEHVLSIEHKHPVDEDIDEEDIDSYTSKTNIRTFSKTHVGPEKPTLRDLDPQMQDILRNAGIVPEIEGDSITKTRKEPDGRVITTTYKVNTLPREHASTGQHYAPLPHIFSQKPRPNLAAPRSNIEEFLAKLGLTKFNIIARNGPYSKTLIDENGDVLTATFVLSSPQGVRAGEKHAEKPIK